ncbi:MAG: CPBP family intramembrane metalloprotease [Ruminococcus sp.]|nr:CPBP family intramembrane metalloprotease [Ruminococcus sp.]
MLAAVRKITGSVWLCVLCHMTVNAIPEVFRYDFCGKASLIVTTVMIAVSLVLFKICETRRTSKKRDSDDV